MQVTMTLAEKVGAVTSAESSLVDRFANTPFQVPGGRTQISLDRQDWILYYGVAVGLARSEEACEPTESLAQRARAAANEAFMRLNWDSPGAGAVEAEIAGTNTEAVAA